MDAESELFSAKHIAQWKAYEKVRKSGRHNMFDPRAQLATGLSREAFLFVMRNYSKLKEAVAKAAQP